MAWMMYILGGLVVGALGLAIYERRKKLRMHVDPDLTRDPARAAYTDAEKIRAEAQITHPPQGGGMF